MADYYDEKWLDRVEGKFEVIIAASQKARRLNEGDESESSGQQKKVVVKALHQVVKADTDEGTPEAGEKGKETAEAEGDPEK